MVAPMFLQSLWGHPAPQRKLIGRTTAGPCTAAGLLAHYLLSPEEAEQVEHQLELRCRTVAAQARLGPTQRGHLTFHKELTFVASLLASPVLLCILGGGNLVRSCAIVDHDGRREMEADEAVRLYNSGVPVVSVDAEETLAICLRSKGNAFEKLRLHEPCARPAPTTAPTPAPRRPILELLERSRRALETDVR